MEEEGKMEALEEDDGERHTEEGIVVMNTTASGENRWIFYENQYTQANYGQVRRIPRFQDDREYITGVCAQGGGWGGWGGGGVDIKKIPPPAPLKSISPIIQTI